MMNAIGINGTQKIDTMKIAISRSNAISNMSTLLFKQSLIAGNNRRPNPLLSPHSIMTTSIVVVGIPFDVSIPAHWPMMIRPIEMFKNINSQHCQKYESLAYFMTEQTFETSFFNESFTNLGLSIIIDPIDIVTRQNAAKKKNMLLMPNNGNAYLNNHAQNVDPSPNDTIDTAMTSALCLDFPNHSNKFFTGVTYPIPSDNPQQIPMPRQNVQMLLVCIARPDSKKPMNSNAVDSHAAFFMFFSTSAPKHNAPVPRKKIFKQNANCTATLDVLSASWTGVANKLNAQQNPIAVVIKKHGTKDLLALYKNVFILLHLPC